MSKYGIPYQGSKSKIAEEILEKLPSGNRLVDLFGGGFAITHCALVKFSDKWNKFLYNDINPLLPPLIKDAINGKYLYENFTPKWISREEFQEKKETDGYIKWVWSFGDNGKDYLYGKNIEELKHKAHDFVVFGTKYPEFENINLTGNDIAQRRLEFVQKAKTRLESLEHLQHLNQLERLSRLESLSRLEFQNIDYRKYQYQEGDVVYCDIPYESTYENDYGVKFNHKEFYAWARSQPFDVYYSNYLNGELIWGKSARVVFKSGANAVLKNEALFKL